MALITRLALRWSMPGRVSQGLTGIPPAMLAASRSIRRSPLLEGSWPALRAVMAASQSVLARRVTPWLMLVPVVMNRPVKSSRSSQLPQQVSRPVHASRWWMPLAAACKASLSWRELMLVGLGNAVVQVGPDFLEPSALAGSGLRSEHLTQA